MCGNACEEEMNFGYFAVQFNTWLVTMRVLI